MSKLAPSMRRRELGRHLRSAQERTGINGLQLATRLGWTPTMMSRALSGRRRTEDVDVSAFLAVCGVIGKERDHVLSFSHAHQDPGFVRLYRDEQWPAFLAHADGAVRVVEFQPLIIPWMVQTPDYTRALLSEAPLPTKRVDEQVAARRAAVALLRVRQVELILHEWLLRSPVHGPTVMSEQLHHLLRMSVRPSVSIRVIPIGRSAGICAGGPFSLLNFPDYPSVVYREDHAGGVLLDSPAEVEPSSAIASRLSSGALDERHSRELISRIAAEHYRVEGADLADVSQVAVRTAWDPDHG